MSRLYRKSPDDKRGKWSDVFKALVLIVVFYMGFRWILFEPFVIPSGSMEQTLLIQDYVVVKKWAYGVRIPFTNQWLLGPEVPKRGDIVVFKSVDDSGHFLVKRVVGLPGDEIRVDEKGFVQVNDTPFVYQELESDDSGLRAFQEDNGEKRYRVQFSEGLRDSPFSAEVPEGHLFMMGDNRHFSADSRSWGSLPLERIMGKLVMIWISCEESESYSSFLCAFKDLRTDRIFKWVDTGE